MPLRGIHLLEKRHGIDYTTHHGELEGDPNKNLEAYATTGTPEYNALVQKIADHFGIDSLRFNTIEDLVASIGLPKCRICTHCFDGSSHF